MSDENGQAGAIRLDAHIYKGRVRDVLQACVKSKRPECPVVGRPIKLEHEGDPDQVNEANVRGAYERAYWAVVQHIRSLGFHERDGAFTVDDGVCGTNPNGNVAAIFILTWTPTALLPVAPNDEGQLSV